MQNNIFNLKQLGNLDFTMEIQNNDYIELGYKIGDYLFFKYCDNNNLSNDDIVFVENRLDQKYIAKRFSEISDSKDYRIVAKAIGVYKKI
ncbi:hypothetical protein [Anaerococcus degeneri]|uniref:Peptidase S24/S26A/S26B/S26C domain-containing protein n=1 Tax=Anaerococcus degeneri TaxID=361500 RepID=A0ABS7YXS9_9FIRM|nr:hypothetical protein [Anaerococcus degeneri]MBP2015349.1 hypothetical protein [Anaerococcus degeneri]MCA2096245.1 hypothetical protein [Anaerococcus degeneri]